ncbi:MAG TPA: O-antigen ligase family protein [Terracidiphilus sp.]|nr:O-antigen ligase family protein [Terracidiphilus sp.]
MRFSILPWNFRAWRSAFAAAGFPGLALLCLMIASLGSALDFGQGKQMHQSVLAILLIRAPFSITALIFVLAKPGIAKVGMRDLRFWFAVFSFLYLASCLWSSDLIITLGKSFEMIVGALILLEASKGPDAGRRLEALGQITFLIISMVALLATLGFIARIPMFVYERPGLVTSTTATAPFVSGNGIGYMASALFLTVFGQWLAKRISWRGAWLQMSYALFIFAFASSRTSFGILALGITIVLLRRSKVLMVGFIAVLGTALWIFRNGVMKVMLQGRSQENIESLSGRVIMWGAAFRAWKEHPILGYGGGDGGKVVLSHINNPSLELSSLHSGFMETLTGLGLIGIIIGSGLLLATTYYTLKEWKANPENAGLYVMIIHIWITSIMSIGVLGWMSYEVGLYFVLIGIIDLSRRKARFNRAVYRMPISGYRPSFAH